MKKKLVEIVIRGCIMKVSPEMAKEIRDNEKKMISKELNDNNLID